MYDNWKTETAEDYIDYEAIKAMDAAREEILNHISSFFKDARFPVNKLANMIIEAMGECVTDAPEIAKIFGIEDLDKSQILALDGNLTGFSMEWQSKYNYDY